MQDVLERVWGWLHSEEATDAATLQAAVALCTASCAAAHVPCPAGLHALAVDIALQQSHGPQVGFHRLLLTTQHLCCGKLLLACVICHRPSRSVSGEKHWMILCASVWGLHASVRCCCAGDNQHGSHVLAALLLRKQLEADS